jgi:hypothetical protein
MHIFVAQYICYRLVYAGTPLDYPIKISLFFLKNEKKVKV